MSRSTFTDRRLRTVNLCGTGIFIASSVIADLDVLEGAFMIRRLQPYFANVQKRLTKSPKLYVRDTGLLHHLAPCLETPHRLEVVVGGVRDVAGIANAGPHSRLVRMQLQFVGLLKNGITLITHSKNC